MGRGPRADSMAWLQAAPEEIEKLLQRHTAEVARLQGKGGAVHGGAGSDTKGGGASADHSDGPASGVDVAANALLGGLRALVEKTSDAAGLDVTDGAGGAAGRREGVGESRLPASSRDDSGSEHSLSDSSEFWYDSDDSFGAPDWRGRDRDTDEGRMPARGAGASGEGDPLEEGEEGEDEDEWGDAEDSELEVSGKERDGAQEGRVPTQREVNAAMDEQLRSHMQAGAGGGSKPTIAIAGPEDGSRDDDVDEELVESLLEAVSEEGQLAGPASSLLRSFGLELPPEWLLAGVAKERTGQG